MPEWVGIEQLHLSPLRPRGSLPEVSHALQRVVDNHGPINPVVVRARGHTHGYEILSNTETWLAAQCAGWHDVPIDVRDDLTDTDATAILAVTSGAGRSDPIEEARELNRQLERLCAENHRGRYGAISRLARLLVKPRTHISHTLRLLKLPPRIQQLVATGQLTAGHARALVTVKDARRQQRLAQRIIRQGLSVRETEAAAQGRSNGPRRAVRPQPDATIHSEDPDVRRLEVTLTDTLGSDTRIDTEGGRLIIHYAGNLDILQGLLERLGCNEA